MTVDIRAAFQAGIEVGRAAVKHEMAELAKLDVAGFAPFNPSDYAILAPQKRAVKAPSAPKAPKAHVVSRGVKKAAQPRTKGVKEEILKVISETPATAESIIQMTGFKETSVRGTLMALKKKGLAFQDGSKLWVANHPANMSGNGGAEVSV